MTNAPPQAGQDTTPTQDALKPCPFCNGPSKRIVPMGPRLSGGPPYYVPDGVRYVCAAIYETPIRECPESDTFYGLNAEAEAIAAWNTRPTTPATDELADVHVAAIWYSAMSAYDHDGIGERDDDAAIDDLNLSLATLRQSPPAPSETTLPALDPYTLEQAAKIAKAHADDRNGRDRNFDWNDGYQDGCMHAAAAIRALIPPGKDT